MCSKIKEKLRAFFVKTQGQISKTSGFSRFLAPTSKLLWAIFVTFMVIFAKVRAIFEKRSLKYKEKIRVFAISGDGGRQKSAQKMPRISCVSPIFFAPTLPILRVWEK